MIKLPFYSRFKHNEMIRFNGELCFGINLMNFKFKPEHLASYIVGPAHVGRSDLISNEIYGTPYFAWIIIAANKILNPIGWPQNGERILIPIRGIVDKILDNKMDKI